MAVVGNKVDLFENDDLANEEARDFANEIGAIFKLVSAKNGNIISINYLMIY